VKTLNYLQECTDYSSIHPQCVYDGKTIGSHLKVENSHYCCPNSTLLIWWCCDDDDDDDDDDVGNGWKKTNCRFSLTGTTVDTCIYQTDKHTEN